MDIEIAHLLFDISEDWCFELSCVEGDRPGLTRDRIGALNSLFYAAAALSRAGVHVHLESYIGPQ